MQLILVSHTLCPYVQRAAIVLTEKQVPFERRYVDLSNKPTWFTDVSPLGKTPVLLVQDTPIFESAVICEYLDETIQPALHPADPLVRARHRAWVEFSSAILNSIWGFYTAADEQALVLKTQELQGRFAQVERALTERQDSSAPYFHGEKFCIVDAAFGPVFRYFDVFDQIADFGFFNGLALIHHWRYSLAQRLSVQQAVQADYNHQLHQFLLARNSALSARMAV